MPIRRVLFVCAGNICRSPIAEAVCRELAGSRPALAGLEVGSAGTIALEGREATTEAVHVARDELGLDITEHRARQVEGLDADLILTMDASVTREVEHLGPGGTLVLLGEYAGTGESVADPYGCAGDVYLACARHIRRLVALAVDRLERETGEA